MNKYMADESSVGEWTNPRAAAARWNRHIAPLLAGATVYDAATGDCEEPVVSIGNGCAKNAAEWAWDEFCASGAGDDESVCIDLAGRLADKLI